MLYARRMFRVLPLLVPLLAGVAGDLEQPNPYLAQAKGYYQVLDFEKCLQRVIQAPAWKSGKPEQGQIQLYGALCAYQLGRRKEAEERFEAALKADPALELPPYSSPKIVEVFKAVRRRLPPPPAPPEDDAPLQVAAPPVLTPAPPKPAPPPVVASAPERSRAPGPVPLTLAGVAVLAAAAGTSFGLHAKALEQQANQAPFESDALALGRSAGDSATAANVAFATSLGAVAAAAVVYWVETRAPEGPTLH